MREIIIESGKGDRNACITGIGCTIRDRKTRQPIMDLKSLTIHFEPEGYVFATGERINPDSCDIEYNTIAERFLIYGFEATTASS